MIVFSSLQIRRGVRVLLDNATATINPGQKVGLVGKNGCGKSTLLALLKNEISADGGSYTFPGSWQLAWVNQETPALPQAALEYVIDGDREYRQLEAQLHDANERNDGHAIATIHGKLDAIDAWSIRSRAASLLHGLGFSNEQLERPVSDFSGGWRMRLNLAQALICRSDLLLLDEPTNHLDLDAVIWLEKWLKSYQGTLILISHDRDFLDPIVDKIIHIEQQSMFEYTGNYSSFEVQRATRLAQQQAMYESQQERVAHLQSYIDRFRAKATKAKQAQSRIKMLERMELIAPAHVDNPFRFSFRAPESLPNPLLKMEKVSAGYGDRIILDSIKLNLVPGSRIGLLGRNGAGKSTLIKLLAGELAPVSGEIGLAKAIRDVRVRDCSAMSLSHLLHGYLSVYAMVRVSPTLEREYGTLQEIHGRLREIAKKLSKTMKDTSIELDERIGYVADLMDAYQTYSDMDLLNEALDVTYRILTVDEKGEIVIPGRTPNVCRLLCSWYYFTGSCLSV